MAEHHSKETVIGLAIDKKMIIPKTDIETLIGETTTGENKPNSLLNFAIHGHRPKNNVVADTIGADLISGTVLTEH